MRKIHRLLASLCLVAVLSQCSDVRVREKNAPVVRLEKQPHGGEYDKRYQQTYRCIYRARKMEKHTPAGALKLYLEAARTAYLSRDEKLLPLYNHAVGQVADLVARLDGVQGVISAPSLRGINDVVPVDCLKIHGWRTHVRQSGVGAPVVLRREKSSTIGEEDIFVEHGAFSYPATVIIEFPASGRPVLRCYDPNHTGKIKFWGAMHLLAYDLTAPMGVSLGSDSSFRRDAVLEWFGVFVPMRFVEKMGLYTMAPLDVDKIPVVFVHGLKSDPVTWRNAINELNADPVLRKRYQFMAFYYPTGLPLRVPAAELKRKINLLHAEYVRRGKRKNAQKMVVIGHSLGGLLTSVQVRKIDPNINRRIFRTPEAEAQLNPEAARDFSYILHGPEPSFLRRVVFISTPHRGSRRADYYVSRLLSSLVEIPKNALTLRVTGTTVALTDFGRSLLGGEKKESSLSLLQSQSATLALLAESPIYPYIRYHSIMGDRGRGDTPHSSDGVVDYASSHLDGAESEKIVPSGHSAENHPETIRELRRILRLNLR